MNGLPLHLLDEILFRLDPKSVAMMSFTNKCIKSHISEDPSFDIGYSSRVGSSLYHILSYGSNYVFCLPFVSSRVSKSPGKEAELFEHRCYILGSCSGLLLLYINGLFVVNPLTKRFRFMDHSGSKLIPKVVGGDDAFWKDATYPASNFSCTERSMCIGFAVERNGIAKRFKIACIFELETMYRFEIGDGDSWRISETTIVRHSESDLVKRMKPVYLGSTLHWLRNDGSIITFNPETEEARFVPSVLYREPDANLFLAPDDQTNCLTLISGTREEISVYTLLEDPEWALAKRIENVYMEESELQCWNVAACDGKRLVVNEKKKDDLSGVVHVYDMEANSWGLLGSTNSWFLPGSDIDFHKFTPSFSFLEDDEKKMDTVPSTDLRISYLTRVMGLLDITK